MSQSQEESTLAPAEETNPEQTEETEVHEASAPVAVPESTSSMPKTLSLNRAEEVIAQPAMMKPSGDDNKESSEVH